MEEGAINKEGLGTIKASVEGGIEQRADGLMADKGSSIEVGGGNVIAEAIGGDFSTATALLANVYTINKTSGLLKVTVDGGIDQEAIAVSSGELGNVTLGAVDIDARATNGTDRSLANGIWFYGNATLTKESGKIEVTAKVNSSIQEANAVDVNDGCNVDLGIGNITAKTIGGDRSVADGLYTSNSILSKSSGNIIVTVENGKEAKARVVWADSKGYIEAGIGDITAQVAGGNKALAVGMIATKESSITKTSGNVIAVVNNAKSQEVKAVVSEGSSQVTMGVGDITAKSIGGDANNAPMSYMLVFKLEALKS